MTRIATYNRLRKQWEKLTTDIDKHNKKLRLLECQRYEAWRQLKEASNRLSPEEKQQAVDQQPGAHI